MLLISKTGVLITCTSSFPAISESLTTVHFIQSFHSSAWKDQEKKGVARLIETLECVMWSSMDRNGGREIVREIDESVIMSNSEIDQCTYCHKSKVLYDGGK